MDKDLIRHYLQLIDNELSDGSEVVTAFPDGSTGRIDEAWHPNGFSTHADTDGFGLVKAITEHEAKYKWPEKLKAKTARRFVAEPLFRTGIFPSPEARAKAEQNLGRRWTTIRGMYTPDASLVGIKPKPIAPRDFNQSPEAQYAQPYVYTDDAILVCENDDTTGTGTGAWSTDWNPEKDAAWLYAQHLDRARAVAPGLGLKLEPLGL